MVNTRRTADPAATAAANSNNTNGENGGSLSAGTRSATNPYTVHYVVAFLICMVLVPPFAIVLACMIYDSKFGSKYEVVICVILELVFCSSYLQIIARR